MRFTTENVLSLEQAWCLSKTSNVWLEGLWSKKFLESFFPTQKNMWKFFDASFNLFGRVWMNLVVPYFFLRMQHAYLQVIEESWNHEGHLKDLRWLCFFCRGSFRSPKQSDSTRFDIQTQILRAFIRKQGRGLARVSWKCLYVCKAVDSPVYLLQPWGGW